MNDSERDTLLRDISENVVELRTVILGVNGFPGMQGNLQTLVGKVEGIEKTIPTLQTKAECTGIRKSAVSHEEHHKLTRREWIMIMLTSVMAIGTVVSIYIAFTGGGGC
jgi:hypothetical protein